MTIPILIIALFVLDLIVEKIILRKRLKETEAFIKTLLKEHGKEVNDPYGTKEELPIPGIYKDEDGNNVKYFVEVSNKITF